MSYWIPLNKLIMSHITYFPTEKNAFNKAMIETLKRFPRATYTEIVTVKDKETGKRKEKVVIKKVSDKFIRELVKKKWIDTTSRSKTSPSEQVPDEDFKKFEKIKSSKPAKEE